MLTFALSRLGGLFRSVNSFESWDDVAEHLTSTPAQHIALPTGSIDDDRLSVRQRLNIGLVVLFGQALQVTLVVAALIGFFVLFGYIAIGTPTVQSWTRLADIHVVTQTTVGSRELIVSEPLLRVAGFLGAFSGMYFTVVLTTDDTYRTEFADDVGPQIREALAVRSAYRVARGTHPQAHRRGAPDQSAEDNGVA